MREQLAADPEKLFIFNGGAMKKGKMVSMEQVRRATLDVRSELAGLGIWHEGSKLLKTDVVWCVLPQVIAAKACGFCFDSGKVGPLLRH